MLALGIDIGTSSVKVAVVDIDTQKTIAHSSYPTSEASIISLNEGWAEQNPFDWWNYVQQAILSLKEQIPAYLSSVSCIGIAYQMHGLVCINEQGNLLRNSIIWCDSRATEIGDEALRQMGLAYCYEHLLNSPANFTASKLAWVKANEPKIFEQIAKILLPGDYIAMQLTGAVSTTITGMSEGVFWDYQHHYISSKLLEYFSFTERLIPPVLPSFSTHGFLLKSVADHLGLKAGIPVSYKAGDQPNNALSLGVLDTGEVAATAGTSGVIYAVSDKPVYNASGVVNSFAHVNYTEEQPNVGMLFCLNGCGIANKWVKNFAKIADYEAVNVLASTSIPGSNGVSVLPFGNGAERMLHYKNINAVVEGINFNQHNDADICRAVQEGVAFAMQYGVKCMQQMGVTFEVIKAGNANMFLSDVFVQTLVNTLNVPVTLYDTDGSIGAAVGAAIGIQQCDAKSYFSKRVGIKHFTPVEHEQYQMLYSKWEQLLNKYIQ
jgi:xylulokinase